MTWPSFLDIEHPFPFQAANLPAKRKLSDYKSESEEDNDKDKKSENKDDQNMKYENQKIDTTLRLVRDNIFEEP